MSEKNKIEILKKRLNTCKFSKLDCGINNLKIEEIYSLIFIYSLAEFTAIDISFDNCLVNKAKKAILEAKIKSKLFDRKIKEEPLLFISCFSSFLYEKELSEIEKRLKECCDSGADFFEIHIDNFHLELFREKIELIKEYFPSKPLSINLSRQKFSNANMLDFIKEFKFKIINELIIEVDGNEKQNNSDPMNQTLQTISTADIVNKQLIKKDIKFRKLPILLSGGTNQKTLELAKVCNVPFNGITVCDYARQDLKKFLDQNNFDNLLKTKEYLDKIRDLKLSSKV